MSRLGIVTIGQAPRSDIVPQMRRYLPAETQIVEAGALDGLSPGEIQACRPRPGEYVLTTRLTTGASVVISKERLMPHLRAAFQRVIEAGVDIVLLLCTGEFPEITGPVLVVRADHMLRHAVWAFSPQRLGVLVPLPVQVEPARARWAEVSPEVVVAPANPYGDPQRIPEAGRALLALEPELIVMDCIGFQEAHRQAVKTVTRVPTLLANAALGRLLAEAL